MTAALRPMTWRDIPVLAALDAELFEHDAWAEPTWWDELAERPRREYVVAVEPPRESAEMQRGHGSFPEALRSHEGGQVLGYAGLDASGEVADVMTIATAPVAQGRGIGRMLLTHLEDRSAARGAERLLLEVRADNAPAQGLYAKHGFAQIAVRKRYYQPGGIDALILSKELS